MNRMMLMRGDKKGYQMKAKSRYYIPKANKQKVADDNPARRTVIALRNQTLDLGGKNGRQVGRLKARIMLWFSVRVPKCK